MNAENTDQFFKISEISVFQRPKNVLSLLQIKSNNDRHASLPNLIYSVFSHRFTLQAYVTDFHTISRPNSYGRLIV